MTCSCLSIAQERLRLPDSCKMPVYMFWCSMQPTPTSPAEVEPSHPETFSMVVSFRFGVPHALAKGACLPPCVAVQQYLPVCMELVAPQTCPREKRCLVPMMHSPASSSSSSF